MMSHSGNTLITGGAGFIGSHLAEALLRSDDRVALMDSFDSFYPPARKRRNIEEVMRSGRATLFECDIRDVTGVDAAFSRFRPSTIIHLAGLAGVRPSLEQPLLYESVNVCGTYTLLEAARRWGIKNFVFASSSSVYGEGTPTPFREDNNCLHPVSPYAASKLATESIAYTYAHLFEMNIACLRLFTVYGPRQRPDLAIHKFTRLVETGHEIPVFGDGTTGRDYTYIDDTVNGICAAAQWCSEKCRGTCEIFNLGNSAPVTLNELLCALGCATGKPVIRNYVSAQPGDVSLTWADIAKARAVLGYQPRTKLSEGLAQFVRWYRDSAS